MNTVFPSISRVQSLRGIHYGQTQAEGWLKPEDLMIFWGSNLVPAFLVQGCHLFLVVSIQVVNHQTHQSEASPKKMDVSI